MNELDCVVIEPRNEPRGAVIWLHGLGADGHDFEPIVPELGLEDVRFVFPHAPVRPVTMNGGMAMRAWYDIAALGAGAVQDAEGIRASAASLRQLVEDQNARGIKPERLVLAGFSQGGAVALHAGLRQPERLAGIMALSTYLPLPESLAQERHEANTDVPIFMAHGLADPVVAHDYGRASCERLRSAGYDVEWHDYRMEHGVVMEEIRDIAAWLQRVLPQP